MEQTINILTERERQLDDIDQAIRETEYPPLNGGPTIQDLAELFKGAAATIQDLAELLKGAAATIEELGDQVDEMEESADRCDELQDAVEDAVNELEDVAAENLEKLAARKKAGTIEGDGDGIIR